MKAVELEVSGLFSEALINECFHDQTKIAANLDLFKEWTTNADSPIYSGYRQQILHRDGLSQSKYLAETFRNQFDTLVVIGIGGSALGTRTGLRALDWSIPADERRTVHVIDTLDPMDFERIWESLDIQKTCFAIISKSGTTLETVAQLSVILQRLSSRQLPLENHLVCITDPEKGALRRWAQSMDIPTLDLPTSVGGRFSVLTTVGLFPLAFAGLDVTALMEGAHDELEDADLEMLARVGQRFCELEKVGIYGHVLMPYASGLKDFGAWFVQLWGESLGKSEINGRAGPIPVAALGDTDQHSLLQLMVEGVQPLISGFIRIENWPKEVLLRPNVAILPPDFASLSYATRKPFWEILNAQQKATAQVLVEKNRPVYEIVCAELSADVLGRLFALYMDLVTMTAAAHNINPFNQPGVERGKQILPELLV